MAHDSNFDGALLLDQDAMQDGAGLPPWLPAVYAEFRRNVLDPDYPCYFATIGEKKKELYYTHVDASNADRLPATMRAFAALSRRSPGKRLALVAFTEPGAKALDHGASAGRFWSLLQHLHDADEAPWPAGVPLDPNDPRFEFSFAGAPMFVFGAAPSYHRRRSRNLGPSLVLLFQPRTVFAGIEGGTPAGVKARATIRGRLAAWDLVAPHAAFCDYGDPSNFEWKQYFVPDDDAPITGPIPLKLRGAATPSWAELGIRIEHGDRVALDDAVRALLPPHGSVEIQRDAPGARHPPHAHDADEVLLILDGTLHFEAGGRSARARPGDRIHLPARAVHASTAGPAGAIYAVAGR